MFTLNYWKVHSAYCLATMYMTRNGYVLRKKNPHYIRQSKMVISCPFIVIKNTSCIECFVKGYTNFEHKISHMLIQLCTW